MADTDIPMVITGMVTGMITIFMFNGSAGRSVLKGRNV
jgi:hypothetical protein